MEYSEVLIKAGLSYIVIALAWWIAKGIYKDIHPDNSQLKLEAALWPIYTIIYIIVTAYKASLLIRRAIMARVKSDINYPCEVSAKKLEPGVNRQLRWHNSEDDFNIIGCDDSDIVDDFPKYN